MLHLLSSYVAFPPTSKTSCTAPVLHQGKSCIPTHCTLSASSSLCSPKWHASHRTEQTSFVNHTP